MPHDRDRRVKPGDDGRHGDAAARPARALALPDLYATADCATVGPSPSSVVRRMSRTSLVSL